MDTYEEGKKPEKNSRIGDCLWIVVRSPWIQSPPGTENKHQTAATL